jgi:hypothetical protein
VRVCALVALAACAPSERPIVATSWLVDDDVQGFHVHAVGPIGDFYGAGDVPDHSDLWITKRSHENGAPVWTIHITGGAWMPHIASDRANDVIVTGFTSGDANFGGTILSSPGTAFVAVFDPDGQLLWVSAVGSGSSCGLAVAASPDGSVYAAGDCSGPIAFGASSFTCAGYYLAAFAADGTPRWATTYATGNYPPAITTSNGHAALTAGVDNEATFASTHLSGSGTLSAVLDADGHLAWAHILPVGPNAAMAGDELVLGDGATLAAYDATGNQRWNEPQPPSEYLDAFAVTPSGTIIASSAGHLSLYDENGATDGERWFADAGLRLEWAVATASGALAFRTASGQLGLTEPID